MTQDNNAPAPQNNPPPPPPLPPTPGPAADVHGVIDYATKPGLSYAGPAPDANARQWGMIAHLSALAQFLGIPTIVGPLVVWMLKKNEHPFIDDQGKEAVNFHLTALIVALIISPTVCLGIGVLLLIGLGLAVLIMSVIGGMKANEGIAYRYPWTLRLIK